jgi:hypothetical protein
LKLSALGWEDEGARQNPEQSTNDLFVQRKPVGAAIWLVRHKLGSILRSLSALVGTHSAGNQRG